VGGRGPLTGRPPPKEISDALKTDRSAIAAHYESASVLFADVVGFTPMAATTIGDCYIVAAGVPRERADHALALVQLALDMGEAAAPDIRRRDACVPHRPQFWAGGRRRDRSQQVHLRSLGRDGEPREPHGIARAKRDHPGEGVGDVDVWRVVGRKRGSQAEVTSS
jgi:Adenylate and Guanylate cyclase catalytic domain